MLLDLAFDILQALIKAFLTSGAYLASHDHAIHVGGYLHYMPVETDLNLCIEILSKNFPAWPVFSPCVRSSSKVYVTRDKPDIHRVPPIRDNFRDDIVRILPSKGRPNNDPTSSSL